MNKVKSIVLLFLMVGVAVGSNDFFIGSDGKHYTNQEVKALEAKMQSRIDASKPTATLRADDFLLEWPDGGSIVNFGFGTPGETWGDSMAIWMQPLANAIVKKIGIFNVNFEGTFEFFLHKSNYAGEVTTSACANAAGWVGHYLDADGNQTAPGEGGTWSAGTNECFSEAPIGAEIWPGLGIGGYSHTLDSTSFMVYTELDFESTLGVSEEITDESFFIDAHAVSTEGWGIGALNTPVPPYHGFKWYVGSGTGTSGNGGWHIRTYGWMVYAMVEYTEDIPPFINYVQGLPTTLSTDARTVEAHVEDANPTGGAAGVESVSLVYSVDGGTEATVAMTATDDTTFTGSLPGASAGESVAYYVTATDVGGNTATSSAFTYNIYAKGATATYLMLFDGLSGAGYPSQYYFYDAYGQYKEWWGTGAGDIWAYGAATAELLDLYDTIIEITALGPIAGNAVAVKTWLDAGSKNYVLAGDEAMGGYYGWPGAPYTIGSTADDADAFFTYLGVTTYNGDINYAASGDQNLPWGVQAVEGDLISGDLYAALTSIPTTHATPRALMYDPYYEISATNWLDGFGVDATVTTAFTASARDTDTWGTDAMTVGAYKADATLSNKVMFLGFDPLSLNSAPSYIWFGARPEGPLFQAMEWFGSFDLVVDEEAQLPTSFALHQNYPNPFNPVTTINFEMPKDGQVTLSVYNMLGQKVSTLVNGVRNAGQHSVTWNGMDDNGQALAAGLYMYRIDAGDYTATKKMVLLK
ncbi:MAG: T9SS type A sorting domain-containing protein [Candidatus Marinimicrobia bacterium]|jgi:hypothetical protein|nr:T9SS type A sorting domain-containing protein [Candidatus Neomarinimicrobiota bacterium]